MQAHSYARTIRSLLQLCEASGKVPVCRVAILELHLQIGVFSPKGDSGDAALNSRSFSNCGPEGQNRHILHCIMVGRASGTAKSLCRG